jgi:hypothetical protein
MKLKLGMFIVTICIIVNLGVILSDTNTRVESKHHHGPKDLNKHKLCDTSKNMFQLKIHKSKSTHSKLDNVFFPVFASKSISTPNPKVTTAVIFIHGFGRNADDYFCNGSSAMKKIPNSIAVTPWFGSSQVDGKYWGNQNVSHKSAWWSTGGWNAGDNTSDNFASSYEILDQLLLALSDKVNFPKMKLISLVGFSAGAQMLQKYSFFSELKVSNKHAKVRVIISDPGSYTYLDATRPDGDCIALKNTKEHHVCKSFSIPKKKIINKCKGYNKFKYGLDKLDARNNFYVKKLTSKDLKSLKDSLKKKDIRFIFGKHDVCNSGNDKLYKDYNNDDSCKPSKMPKDNKPKNMCKNPHSKGRVDACDTWPATTANVFDKKCQGMLQGSNRLQRGRNYLSYLHHTFGFTPINSIFNGAHDANALYKTPIFLEWISSSKKQKHKK